MRGRTQDQPGPIFNFKWVWRVIIGSTTGETKSWADSAGPVTDQSSYAAAVSVNAEIKASNKCF